MSSLTKPKMFSKTEAINEYCGEIFRSAFKTFEYFCSFCGMKFSSGADFENHAIDHFLDVEDESDESADEATDGSDQEDSSTSMKEEPENEPGESTDYMNTSDPIDVPECTDEDEMNELNDKLYDQTMDEKLVASPVVLVKDIVTSLATMETSDWLVTCNCCGQLFACNGLRDQHVHKSRPAYSKCSKCPAYFSDRMSRLQHTVLHSLPASRQFKCPHCSRVFATKESLTDHVLKNQPQENLPDSIKPILPPIVRPFIPPSYECDICGRKYASKVTIEKHLEAHVTFQTDCFVCRKHFTNVRHLRTHMLTHSDTKIHQCNQCDKSYKHRSSLNTHKLTHDRKMFMCHECGKSYASQAILNTHIREVHTRLKNFICAHCDEAFTKRSLLKDHLRAKHTFDRPYACELCNKTFTSSRYLSMHKIIHSNRTFQCRYCERVFNNMKNRRTHEKRKHLHFVD